MSGERGETQAPGVKLFGAAALAVFFLDQASKLLAVRFLSGEHTIPLWDGVFHLTLVYNTGIAFGFFRNHPEALTVTITLSLIFLFFWGWRMRDTARLPRLAVGIIFGGAVGNWLDRVRLGAVVDFLDFRVWPVFNIADSAITIGVGIFILLMMKERS